MNQDPVISVCIPAYRRTGFLQRLLDSLQIQTYSAFEIVVTDDSPDDSVLTLVQAHPLTGKIRYFKNPVTLGTPENWNEGLRKAKGEWIKIMHDDDWFSAPDSLHQFFSATSANDADFYFCGYSNVLPDGKKEHPFRAGNYVRALNANPEILLASNRIGPPSVVLFRRKPDLAFDNRMKWLVDIDFYIRYLKQSRPAVYLPGRWVNIGISESQVTQTSFGNPAVEIPERMLLGEKLGYSSLHNWRVYDSWWRFVRNMRLRSVDQLSAHGYSGPVPGFLRSMIRRQSRFPVRLLANGFFSKLTMTTAFVMNRLKNR